MKHHDIDTSIDQAHDTGLLLAMLDATTHKWRREIGRVGRESVVWQPYENSHSIGMLVLHMADVEGYWLHAVAASSPLSKEDEQLFLSQETRQYDGIWPKPPRKPLSWFYEQHDRIRNRTRELLSTLNDADFTVQMGSRSFTIRWLLHHVIHHEAYHAGQAALLHSLHRKSKKVIGAPAIGPSTIR